MPRLNAEPLSLGPLKGLNTTDNPLMLEPGWATEAENLSLDPETGIAVKRTGFTTEALPVRPAGAFTHNASASFAQFERWTIALNGFGQWELWRAVGAAAWGLVSAGPGFPRFTRGVSFNGKLYLVHGSTSINRVYCWDGNMVRFVGLSVSAAPTVANTGAGAYPATPRTYKVDWIYINPVTSRLESRSELSPSVSFTPSGAGTAARVTKPATLEHATHWRVWAAAGTSTVYRKISGDIPVGTTTYDDSVVPASYTGDFAALVGTFLPPPGANLIITDGNRLIFGGSQVTAATGTGETAAKRNRVWFTPVLGSLDQADDERIPNTIEQKNFLDVGHPPIQPVTELNGPLEGQIFVFTPSMVWRMVPTGDLTTPYLLYCISKVYGAGRSSQAGQIPNQYTWLGEDENGAPALYFWCWVTGGLYRVASSSEIHYVSYDVQKSILELAGSVQPDGVTIIASEVLRQTWLCLGSINNPDGDGHIFVFHWQQGRTSNDRVVRGGWTRWTHAHRDGSGFGSGFFCGALMPRVLGGTSRITDEQLLPTMVNASSGDEFHAFVATDARDGTYPYAANVTAPDIVPNKLGGFMRVGPAVVVATASPRVQLQVEAIRDFGAQTTTALVSLTADGDEARVIKTVEDLLQSDVRSLAIRIGDAVPTAEIWQIDQVTVPLSEQEAP